MTVLKIKNRISVPLGVILLRNWHLRDETALQKNANSFGVWKNMADPFPHPYTLEDARDYITSAVNTVSKKVLAIDFNYEAVGACEITLKSGAYKGNAEIQFWIGEQFWNKGIGTHVVNFLARTAFEELKMRRVYAKVFETNNSSCRILQKNNFQLEATFRNAVLKNEHELTELVYAKLNPAFEKTRQIVNN